MYIRDVLDEKQYQDFLICFKENRPYFVEELNSGIPTFPNIENFKDLEALERNWKSPVDIHDKSVKDETKTTTTTTKVAFEEFSKGCGLLFNDINNNFLELNEIIENVKSELGLPQVSYGRNLLYATPGGGGSATHFDQNFNLVFQLTGTKQWNLTENTSVVDPLTRHALGQEMDPELESYIEEVPSSIDKFDHTYELTAGSFLFVPVGCWHNTQASKDSLAMNFTFSTPSWAEMLLTALRARLVSSPNWRKRVSGLNLKQDVPYSIEEFQKLINSLSEDISNWDAGMILSMLEGRDIRE